MGWINVKDARQTATILHRVLWQIPHLLKGGQDAIGRARVEAQCSNNNNNHVVIQECHEVLVRPHLPVYGFQCAVLTKGVEEWHHGGLLVRRP